ncbi:hypothetical protein K502DRAFT_363410 [Neoconidiobolus thromboides FSU 785]|nr:hypothetical protein K502DRAFT_363410 [Neoconidiobolus thromboides FSU 785]
MSLNIYQPFSLQLSTHHIMISSPDHTLLSPLYERLKVSNFFVIAKFYNYSSNFKFQFSDVQVLMIHQTVLVSIYDIRFSNSIMQSIMEILDPKLYTINFYNDLYYRDLIKQINQDPLILCNNSVLHKFYNSIVILHYFDNVELEAFKRHLKIIDGFKDYKSIKDDEIHILLLNFYDVRVCDRVKAWLNTLKSITATCFYEYDKNMGDINMTIKLRAEKNRLLSQYNRQISTATSSSSENTMSRINNKNQRNQNGISTSWKGSWKIEDTEKVLSNLDQRTTFMIKNIPNKYTQSMLLDVLNQTHLGEFNFLYLRMDFINKCNVGYAFINFISKEAIIKFIQIYVGNRWPHFKSEKRCDLAYATIQGIHALINHFQNSSVLNHEPSFRPLLFYTDGELKGQSIAFPTPEME